jgi:hypothetical protein
LSFLYPSLFRTLEEAIQASSALELCAPCDPPSIAARFDVWGGLIRFVFSLDDLDTLTKRLRNAAASFNVESLSASVNEQVKKVTLVCSLPFVLTSLYPPDQYSARCWCARRLRS